MRATSSPTTSARRPAPSSPMSASSRSELVLPPVLALAGPGAWGVFLVKPQFEVGRQALGKGGIVRDPGLAERTAADIAGWLESEMGWRADGIILSPIEGGDGNREFLLGARRD